MPVQTVGDTQDNNDFEMRLAMHSEISCWILATPGIITNKSDLNSEGARHPFVNDSFRKGTRLFQVPGGNYFRALS